jgi:hypothetical protein
VNIGEPVEIIEIERVPPVPVEEPARRPAREPRPEPEKVPA